MHEEGKGVLLVLTAPWNWDHFLLPDRLFRDEQVLPRLGDRWIPVVVDASIHPELRARYAIRSGLFPSLHFLDAEGRPIVSFPPMGAEELSYYLDTTPLTADETTSPVPERPAALEMRADVLSNRCGRLLLDLYDRGERRLPVVHDDVRYGDLAFFAELSGVRLRRRSLSRLERDCAALLQSALYDSVFGGVHRSVALANGAAVHREMTLRQNAEAGALMAAWFRRTGRDEAGPAAAGFVRLLNDRFRVGQHAIYAGSLSADLYDRNGELALPGERYYERDLAGRRMAGLPVLSDDAPAGANWVVQETLLQSFRTWGDERMRRAMADRGPLLREQGLEPDGTVRATLDAPGAGNLRDQGDAGCGLLAEHAATGSPGALRAAERLADAMLARFRDGKNERRFRSVARDAPWPSYAKDAPPDPEWNGIALRFLAELAAVTHDDRRADFVREALEEWAEHMPANGDGAGELGRAALRSERGMGVILIDAPAGSEEGERLAKMALRIVTPLGAVRWLEADERQAVAKRFGVSLEDEPAAYVCWGEASAACRRARDVQRAWLSAINRVW